MVDHLPVCKEIKDFHRVLPFLPYYLISSSIHWYADSIQVHYDPFLSILCRRWSVIRPGRKGDVEAVGDRTGLEYPGEDDLQRREMRCPSASSDCRRIPTVWV